MRSEAQDSPAVFIPVILAGGSGTRFWPRSRRARAKQVLALDGDRTMIQQTVDRLMFVAAKENIRIIANDIIAQTIQTQLPEVLPENLICEPAARNTAPACGLAAFLLERDQPNAVIGIFPSDHVIMDPHRFAVALGTGIAIAAAGENIVVLGVPPTRPETGYGYIEQGDAASIVQGLPLPARHVHRFTEKPDRKRAAEFVASGRFAWNSGIFLWSAKTLCNALREHSPELAAQLQEIADASGTPDFEKTFARVYPLCENISIDYAVLEPRSAKGESASNVYCIPAEFGWNDLGSWTALHEHQISQQTSSCDSHANVVDSSGSVVLTSSGNYVYAPGKQVALVGVHDLVVVETEDALLITTREGAQEVGGVVKALNAKGLQQFT